MSGTRDRPATDGATIPDLIEVVAKSIRLKQKSSSAEVTLDTIRRFARYSERARGVRSAAEVSRGDVEAFVHAPRSDGRDVKLATKHSRRSAVRTLYQEACRLGLVENDPTQGVVLEPRRPLDTRPLTDAEIQACRLAAEPAGNDLRVSTLWALAEATARVAEMGFVKVGDVDLASGRIHLPGGTRMDERRSPLSEWAFEWIGHRLATRPEPQASLVPWSREDITSPANAATMALIAVMKAAGVHGPNDVHALSITGWTGARLFFDEHWTIEDVALALGCRSLDATARMIGLTWRSDRGPER
jgi:site-specific recombinase XerD